LVTKFFFAWILILPFVHAQQEIVLPWVAQKDGSWSSLIAVNNHADQTLQVSLKAVRANGEQQTTSLSLPAGGHWSGSALNLFSSLGSGSGYCVFLSADGPFSAGVKVSSTASSSGDSPALGQGMPSSTAGSRLILSFLPFEPSGSSAPVLVNLSDSAIDASLTLHTPSGVHSATITVPARRPFAGLMSDLFPGIDQAGYLLAESTGPLAGAAFNFNALREPSLLMGTPLSSSSDEEMAALSQTLETTSTLLSSYAVATGSLFKQSACPTVDVQVNMNNQNGFITGSFNWGSGCTNLLGVTHSGSIALSLSREGTLQTGGWMKGDFSLNQFTSQYMGQSLAIDGFAHCEGSTKTANFTLSGQWSGQAAYYGVSARATSSTYLSVNNRGSHYEAFGSFRIQYDATYYGSLYAEVPTSSPLVYQFTDCPWPTSGRLDVTWFYGVPVHGSIDFATGDCNTARVTVNGVTTTYYLPGVL